MLKQIPNALTLARLVLAPVIAWAIWCGQLGDDRAWSIVAAVLFVIAALTDLFDGMAARALHAESKFGRVIDPIADKALVGLPLIALSLVLGKVGWPLWPLVAVSTAVIVVRDILMTWIRLSSSDGEGPRVSILAKWKTALELIAVGAAVLAALVPGMFSAGVNEGPAPIAWLIVLTIAAGLSAYTAARYFLVKPST